jgi:hypothetical protein
LAADAWIRAIEAKFSVFTLPCSEERKASFAALQLRGAVLIWWENFKTMTPEGHKSHGLSSSRPSRNITFLKVPWIEI